MSIDNYILEVLSEEASYSSCSKQTPEIQEIWQHCIIPSSQIAVLSFLLCVQDVFIPLVFPILQSKFTALMYISDMDHMEPMARALLKYGANVEIAIEKVSLKCMAHSPLTA